VRFTVGPEVAEEICHCRGFEHARRSERESANRAQLLLELTGDARVEGEMAGIVRARRELVDEQLAAAREEEFDADYADDVEGFENCSRDFDGALLDLRRDICR